MNYYEKIIKSFSRVDKEDIDEALKTIKVEAHPNIQSLYIPVNYQEIMRAFKLFNILENIDTKKSFSQIIIYAVSSYINNMSREDKKKFELCCSVLIEHEKPRISNFVEETITRLKKDK